MDKNRFFLLLALVLLVALGSQVVLAASDNVIEPILDMLDKFNIAGNYAKYHIVVDFVIYLIIFVGVARQFLGERMGKGPAVGIGIILALSLTSFEYKLGYSVTDFGLLAAIILALVIGYFIFRFFSSNGSDTFTGFAISFVLVYLLLQKMLIEMADSYPMLYGIISLLFIICLFKTVISIVNMFAGGGISWPGRNTNTPVNTRTQDFKPPVKQLDNIENKVDKEIKEVNKETDAVKNDTEHITELTHSIIENIKKALILLVNIEDYVKMNLQPLIKNIWQLVTQSAQVPPDNLQNLNVIAGRLENLYNNLVTLTGEILVQFESLSGEAKKTKSGIQKIRDDLTKINSDITYYTQRITEIKKSIEKLPEKVRDGFWGKFNQVFAQITTLNGDITLMSVHLQNDTITPMATELQKVETGVNIIKSIISSLMAIKTKLESIINNISGLAGSGPNGDKINQVMQYISEEADKIMQVCKTNIEMLKGEAQNIIDFETTLNKLEKELISANGQLLRLIELNHQREQELNKIEQEIESELGKVKDEKEELIKILEEEFNFWKKESDIVIDADKKCRKSHVNMEEVVNECKKVVSPGYTSFDKRGFEKIASKRTSFEEIFGGNIFTEHLNELSRLDTLRITELGKLRDMLSNKNITSDELKKQLDDLFGAYEKLLKLCADMINFLTR